MSEQQRTPFVINPHRQRDRVASYAKTRYPVPHVPLHGKPHKSCAKCCRLKQLGEFRVKAGAWDGLANRCIECEEKA